MNTFRAFLAFILAISTPANGADINGQLKSAQLEKLASDPTSSQARIYFNTVTAFPKFYDGSAWRSVLSENTTQSVASKTLDNTNTVTLKDTLFTLQDDGDATKQLRLQLSGITAGNVRTLTVPDASTTVVGTDTTDTLTNKTLTSPKLNENVAVTTTATKLNYLTSATGTTGTTSTNVVFSTSPTLVTPTIGVATATSVNKVAITAPASSATLTLADGSTLATVGAFSTTLTATGATGVTLPTTGTLATLAGTEAFTAKDYQGGTASNTSRLTVPKDTLTNLTALTRKQATVAYDTTGNQLLVDDGSNLNAVGGGSGEKNYVGSGSNNAGGWAASGAGFTVATATTGLPRPNTTKTGILLTGASGSTAYAYYRYILDDADAGKKLKIKFDMLPVSGYAASDFKVDMYSNTANDYTTGNTRLVLSTDSSSITALPNLTGTFQTTFDAPAVSAKYLELRIGLNGTNTHALTISDVIVGPGIVTQGAALSEWVSYTPVPVNVGSKVFTTDGRWRRIGDTMEVVVQLNGNTVSAGAGASFVYCPLPSGFNVDSSKYGTSTVAVFGYGHEYGVASAGTVAAISAVPDSATTTSGFVFEKSNGNFFTTGDLNVARAVQFNVHAFIPISQWTGSGSVNVVQNDVEYVYNTSGTTAANGSDTTSFGYGPIGAAIGSIASTTVSSGDITTMRVRFPTPVQGNDIVQLEFDPGNNGQWSPAGQTNSVMPATRAGAAYFGAALSRVSATDYDVFFGNGGKRSTNATFGSAGEAWSGISTGRWRVAKYKGGNAIGFSNVAQSTSGLVKSAGQLLGTNTNDDANAGYVGEYKVGRNASTPSRDNVTRNAWANVAQVTLTPGDWDVSGVLSATASGATITNYQGAVSANSDTTTTDHVQGDNLVASAPPTSANDAAITVPNYRVTVASGSTQIMYLKTRIDGSAGTPTIGGRISARRMR